MKKIILAVAASALLASPAFAADNDQDSFVINAEIPEVCTMDNINDIDLGTLSVNTNSGSGALIITTLLASENAGQFWLSCNDNNRMTFSRTNGRLKNVTRSLGSGDDPAFTDEINYEVNAVNYVDSGLQPGCVSGLPCLSRSRGAIHRRIDMIARTSALLNLGRRPIAGEYQDTVTVTVTTI